MIILLKLHPQQFLDRLTVGMDGYAIVACFNINCFTWGVVAVRLPFLQHTYTCICLDAHH